MTDELVLLLIQTLNPSITFTNSSWNVTYTKNNKSIVGVGTILFDAMRDFYMKASTGIIDE